MLAKHYVFYFIQRSAPVYVVATSTPVSEVKANWNATKATSRSQSPAFLQICSVEKGSLPFTGKENPFVPITALVPVISTDFNQKQQENKSSQSSIAYFMHDDQVNVNSTPKDWSIFKLRPTASTNKVPQTSVVQPLAKTNPLRSILAKDFKEKPNNFRLPGLQPVSPRSQIRMELEAGMKPSLPSHQYAKQININPVPVFPKETTMKDA